MSTGSQNLELEFASDDALTGFRLERLEVLNWGTFDQQVWTLSLQGKNCLLTGDIGSGKSTLVDAVTTLLVPAHRIAYNKAAGAEHKERSLKSYVLGHYLSKRNESGNSTTSIGLRDANSFSVILGVFRNTGYDQTVTLACVFWMKDPASPPTRFFAASEQDLTIPKDFSDFGSDMNLLRKRLRKNQVEVFDSFPPYSAWFRRRFGIENEQALDLFHQTVSMKSVGNLTDFVRSHMLEASDVASRIEDLIEHFDDLNRAHEAVQKAKRQIDLLKPLVAHCQKHADISLESLAFRECRDHALHPYITAIKQDLLDKRLETLDNDWQLRTRQITQLAEKLREDKNRADELKRDIAEQGGDRLEKISQEIQHYKSERDRRRSKSDRYADLLNILSMSPATDDAGFIEQHRKLDHRREQVNDLENDLQNRLTEQNVRLQEQQKRHQELTQEIVSLEARKNNLPAAQIRIRQTLCQALSLDPDQLPFAGELLQVREQELAWEGAIERILHHFGLSLLVPDSAYADVAAWVDKTHLQGKLVYYRVRPVAHHHQELHPDSLVKKLRIKAESLHQDWLDRELSRRFDMACCETHEQFRRESHAVSRAGQIKRPGEQHEKDDRHLLSDRSRYVLGWTNTAKIESQKSKRRDIEKQIVRIKSEIADVHTQQKNLRSNITALAGLAEYNDFRDLNWQQPAREIEKLEAEKRQILTASDILKQLNQQLRELKETLTKNEQNLSEKQKDLGGIESKQNFAREWREETQLILNQSNPEIRDRHQLFLTSLYQEIFPDQTPRVESCENQEKSLRENLQAKIDAKDKLLKSLQERIVKAMSEYRNGYPVETQEVDATVEAGPEYQSMLTQLESDDLPRFEEKFKELLNVNTIREIANFSSQLSRLRDSIRERVEQINHSLNEIDYNPDRYILLETQATSDAEIREFQSELRACTENTLTGSGDAQYSEAKFIQVQRMIARFRGRPGQTDADKRWTQKVTDVRNWFHFSASERWREDHSEHEHYSDSGGKSGGQKEKLAYTILAASLAYQFGLEWDKVRSRSFRFVVIDEAFGRGSDESAEYGLRLFDKLNLQLLIVTPLQKIHVIENHISSVGFVYNPEGKASMLRNLTIEAYKAEKIKRTT